MVREVMWEPPTSGGSRMKDFTRALEKRSGRRFSSYNELHSYSIDKENPFWQALWEYFSPIAEGDCSDVGKSAFLHYDWFPKIRLNYAENLLCHSEEKPAIHFVHESGMSRRLTYGELRDEVSSLQQQMAPYISPGDVVAAYAPNVPETAIAMLAATGLGALFTSTSCDFGVQGVLDRFSQTEPKLLIAATRYTYGGKEYDLRKNIEEIANSLPSLKKKICFDFLDGNSGSKSGFTKGDGGGKKEEPIFVKRAFGDPLFILYSSGTTGKPKCIVHGVGGTLLNHLKELALHIDVDAANKIAYFTTCGWMMWNWLLSSLALGAEVVLYEGSPNGVHLLEVADDLKIDILGVSPKYLKSLEMVASFPELSTLTTLLSTGSPLTEELYDFVYREIKGDLRLVSISGGTDILGCFALGNPMLPIVKGELQCLALGMDVAVFDGAGKSLIDANGELVCRNPFPNMPLYFWNDPENKRYKKAYFSRYPDVWHHGDFVRITRSGTMKIFGRSDATLNPGGVRIGTSEIYRLVETIDYIDDALCAGREIDGDEVIVLFVVMHSGELLTDRRMEEIRSRIRERLSPRHQPKEIYAVSAIPYSGSGKKQEILVANLLNGISSDNVEVVVNPECLEEYRKAASRR